MVLRIKDWHKFQHFKDRRPPWVKLYRELLDDIDWHELDARAAKALVMLWLIASENDGYLPETKKLAFRLRMSETAALDVLSKLSHWLEQGDIKAISGRYQSDAPETEVETEVEGETEIAPTELVGQKADAPYKVPACPYEDIVKAYAQTLPGLPQVAVMSDARRSHIAARWKAVCGDQKFSREQGVEWFHEFFVLVSKSAFLTGNSKPSRDTGRVWSADFDWLLLPTNFVKVVEGRYQERKAA